ncbi:hypothetical protein [Actinoplanes sp. DH11]|uniref:hypothetical protein n=1 Tax=Actinoplanes sp. DH11 TaxID=2857011 RepID=UPI001E4AC46E|nr:hypothetical protein [Actinoplanes sp. DH11]
MARTEPQRNERFRVARTRLQFTRQALADAANQHLPRLYSMNDNDIGKIERGVVTWPGSERRAALRKVLGAATDDELGSSIPVPSSLGPALPHSALSSSHRRRIRSLPGVSTMSVYRKALIRL